MIQYQLINIFKETFKNNNQINAAIMYGSFARKDANVNSDLDFAILVNTNFDINNFVSQLKQAYNQFNIITAFYVKLRNKVVIHFVEIPKIEITFLHNITDIERNYKGSVIPKSNIENSIIFDKSDSLQPILKKWAKEENKENINEIINDLVSKFIYEFESCSSSHARSDGYKFYYFYNIAFHIAVQLKYLTKGNTDYYFLPKNLTSNIITEKTEQEEIYEISGSTYLPNANKKKRLLLNLFYSALADLNFNDFASVKNSLEQIYKRDFLWNFRDLAKHNTKIKSNKVFRTSSLTTFQDEEFILPLLNNENITTIIDLRADHEINKRPYKNEFIENFNYVKMPLDPWNQPEWFKKELDDSLSNEDKAYYFFLKACKKEIKTIFETILNTNGTVVIHCVAGKDRTGLIAMLISMLTGAAYQELLNDYLATEMDTTERKFRIYYDYIINYGGINEYLKSCGIFETQIFELKKQLANE